MATPVVWDNGAPTTEGGGGGGALWTAVTLADLTVSEGTNTFASIDDSAEGGVVFRGGGGTYCIRGFPATVAIGQAAYFEIDLVTLVDFGWCRIGVVAWDDATKNGTVIFYTPANGGALQAATVDVTTANSTTNYGGGTIAGLFPRFFRIGRSGGDPAREASFNGTDWFSIGSPGVFDHNIDRIGIFFDSQLPSGSGIWKSYKVDTYP